MPGVPAPITSSHHFESRPARPRAVRLCTPRGSMPRSASSSARIAMALSLALVLTACGSTAATPGDASARTTTPTQANSTQANATPASSTQPNAGGLPKLCDLLTQAIATELIGAGATQLPLSAATNRCEYDRERRSPRFPGRTTVRGDSERSSVCCASDKAAGHRAAIHPHSRRDLRYGHRQLLGREVEPGEVGC